MMKLMKSQFISKGREKNYNQAKNWNFVRKCYAFQTKRRLLVKCLLTYMTQKKFELIYWNSM